VNNEERGTMTTACGDAVLAQRRERIETLKEHYPPTQDSLDALDPEERFLLVQQQNHDGDWFLATTKTFEDAAEYLGDEILDGWIPEAIYDLDTGERIELHVSSPIVTRSEDQGIMVNPLDEG
jgi:hypothetical protein